MSFLGYSWSLFVDLLSAVFWTLPWCVVHFNRKVTFVVPDWTRMRAFPPIGPNWNARRVVHGRMSVASVNRRPVEVCVVCDGVFSHVDGPLVEIVKIADEGITWCYGWRGEAVDALRASTVISS